MTSIIFKLTILLGATFWVASVSAEKCSWVRDNEPCPSGEEEVYHDIVDKPGHVARTNRLCCTTGSKTLESNKQYATACRGTTCENPTSGEMCNVYLRKRYLPGNNTPLDYEEMMRDKCEKDDGSEGATALCCVRASPEAVLVTARGAEIHEFPHQAKLKLPGHCGGTVYNSKWIVTAAHCIVDKETGHVKSEVNMTVLLGTNNGEIEEKKQFIYTYKVKRAIAHEEYSRLWNHTEFIKAKADNKQAPFYNDIALLELDREIQFSDKVKSLEIAPEAFDPLKYADNVVKIGWGTDSTGKISSHLHKANLVLRNDTECSTVWHHNIKDRPDTLICIGGVMYGQWSATAGAGDSGGPAICRKANGHPVLCGVTSYGGDDDNCTKYADEKHCQPSVYTEVAAFRDWIKGHAGEQDSSTFYKPILYGKEVKKGEIDHQVHIKSDKGKSCGGTLLASDLVLTAQQCVISPEGHTYGGIQVTAGIIELDKPGQTLGLAGVIPMEGFKMVGKPVSIADQGNRIFSTDNYYKNDLALLKLDGKVNGINKFPELPEDGTVFETGVELALPRDTYTKFGGRMRSRQFRILDHGDCQRRLNRLEKTKVGKIKVDENIMCGVERYSGASECNRELGGGLICQGGNGKDVLCGVQIFRLCQLSIPNGFFNLAYEGMNKWVTEAKKAAQKF